MINFFKKSWFRIISFFKFKKVGHRLAKFPVSNNDGGIPSCALKIIILCNYKEEEFHLYAEIFKKLSNRYYIYNNIIFSDLPRSIISKIFENTEHHQTYLISNFSEWRACCPVTLVNFLEGKLNTQKDIERKTEKTLYIVK